MQSEESNTLVKLAKAVIEHAPEGCDAFWDIKFSDIEAALSAAEPVRWMWEERRGDSHIWDDMYDDEKPEPNDYIRNIVPLYAAPPAPSVAVKALADAYQKYLDASALYNERLAIAKTKALGTMRVDEERKAIDDARRAFDKLAVEVATAALSAQVQDVVRYSGPCSLDEFVSALFTDGAHDVDMKNALDEWLNQDYTEALSYLDSKTRSRLLPAAPATQEGGK